MQIQREPPTVPPRNETDEPAVFFHSSSRTSDSYPKMKLALVVIHLLAKLLLAAATNTTITVSETITITGSKLSLTTTLSDFSVQGPTTTKSNRIATTTVAETVTINSTESTTSTLDQTIKTQTALPDTNDIPAAIEDKPAAKNPTASEVPRESQPEIKQKKEKVPSVIFDNNKEDAPPVESTSNIPVGSSEKPNTVPDAGSSINQVGNVPENTPAPSSSSNLPMMLAVTGAAALVCIGGFLMYRRKSMQNINSLIDLHPKEPKPSKNNSRRKNSSHSIGAVFPSFQRKEVYSFESDIPVPEPLDLSKQPLRKMSTSTTNTHTYSTLNSQLSSNSKEIADAAIYMAGIDCENMDNRISLESIGMEGFEFSDGIMRNEYRIESVIKRDTVRDL